MHIVILAMILLAAFVPYALHMDRVDRLNETKNTTSWGANRGKRQ